MWDLDLYYEKKTGLSVRKMGEEYININKRYTNITKKKLTASSASCVRILKNTQGCVFKLTYDPGYDEDLHPGEGGGFHTKQLRGVVVDGHVGQQRCSPKPVRCIQDQQAKKYHEGSCVGHKLQERSTHKFS